MYVYDWLKMNSATRNDAKKGLHWLKTVVDVFGATITSKPKSMADRRIAEAHGSPMGVKRPAPKSPRIAAPFSYSHLLVPPPTSVTTSLPPLVPSDNSPLSPRRERDNATPRTEPTVQQLVDHEYSIAQVDVWPLTLQTSGRMARNEDDPLSPLSPRQRKVQTRHKTVEESKSKPLLLQEMHAFVQRELQVLDEPTALSQDPESSRPSFQRLDVFRRLFQRVIEAFTVYAPILSQIKDEYEHVIECLAPQCSNAAQLQSQLQTLQTRCLHEISAYTADARQRCQTLKRSLRQTQGQLTACAAQNAQYVESNQRLQQQLDQLLKRNEDKQLSIHVLVNSIKRHDETLSHVHDRSREESKAMSQVTSKYHHALEEIAELKKTVAALEEKVGGVHLAADKATIALLTHEIQQLHTKQRRQTKTQAQSERICSADEAEALTRVFTKCLEMQGAPYTIPKLVELLASCSETNPVHASLGFSSTISSLEWPSSSRFPAEVVEKAAAVILERLGGQLHQDPSPNPSKDSSATTFLTEPGEVLALSTGRVLLPPSAQPEYFTGRGTGTDVPEYLQHEGLVRNRWYSQCKVEQTIMRVWQQQDDLEKAKRNHHLAASGKNSHLAALAPSLLQSTGNHGRVPLAKVFTFYLNRACGSRVDAIECAYNLVDSLERLAPVSSDCYLFRLILQEQLPDEARQEQAKQLYAVYDTLFALERERHGDGDGVSDSNGAEAGDHVPLSVAVRSLRLLFPWKADSALSALHRSLLLDLNGSPHVNYGALLLHQEDKSARRRSHFAECLRMQFIDDLLVFRQRIQQSIEQSLVPTATETAITQDPAATASSSETSGSVMISLRTLRECIQKCDVTKPVQEINSLLCTATGLSMDQILTQDAMVIDGRRFLRRLPTLLIAPTGKVAETTNPPAASDQSPPVTA